LAKCLIGRYGTEQKYNGPIEKFHHYIRGKLSLAHIERHAIRQLLLAEILKK
jgi:hypothetical protein